MIRILTIDDSKAVHAFLNECFKETICVLDHAFNGKEGVQKVEQSKNQPYDLILLDWEMPVMTGPEAYAHISKLGLNTPVIMLTSKNEIEDITKMISEGVTEYMMKPFTTDILLEKVEFILAKEVRKHVSAA